MRQRPSGLACIAAIRRRFQEGVGRALCPRKWPLVNDRPGNVIGGSIFGVTGKRTRLVGRPAHLHYLQRWMAVIAACVAEVASQFWDAGGVYLYVPASLGRLAVLFLLRDGCTGARQNVDSDVACVHHLTLR